MSPSSDHAAPSLDSVKALFGRLGGDPDQALFSRVWVDVVRMFGGEYLDYQKSDTPYHDLGHTLEVTHTLAQIFEGRCLAQATPSLSLRLMDLGLIAALLHDTGYLKLRSDRGGTGAKYTFSHVLRSCAVASSYLPPLGISLDELDDVLGAIRCTHTGQDCTQLPFRNEAVRTVGLAVATADYIGQMAAPDYVEALPKLFAEFEESDDYTGVPAAKRQFRSAAELIAHTPEFWREVVKPKLDHELGGLYRFLARPAPDGTNVALRAIEANLARIPRSSAS